MISGDFTNTENLLDFYNKIYECHKKAHGVGYMDVHDEIAFELHYPFSLYPGGKQYSYRELGVNQGATAACALLCKPTKMRIYDIKLSSFEPYQHLFDKYAKEHRIDFQASEKSSLDTSIVEDVDVLYIDTIHTPWHLVKELNLHHSSVKNTIICHDTFANTKMHEAIVEWCTTHPWKILSFNQENVGFTTLERTE